tara:strand:- start:12945 stop:14201 length:1257 start_codon:yes stop_codon:yes gene_type:complete
VKISKDTFFLILDKLFQLTSSLILGVVLARYLSVDSFGSLSYVIGIASIFIAFSKFGLDNIVIHELVKGKNINLILSSAFLIKLVLSFLITITSYLLLALFLPEKSQVFFIVLITASSIFQSFEIVDFANQSVNKNIYSVYARLLTLIVIVSVRLLGVFYGFDLSFFIYTYFFEKFLLAMFYLSIKSYLHNRKDKFELIFDIETIKYLIKRSWPLSLSTLMVLLYMKVDMIMLNYYFDLKVVGLYSIATRLIDMLYILPTLIMTSIMPKLVMYYSQSNKDFDDIYSKLFKTMYAVSLASITLTFYFGADAISFIFGSEYKDSASILLLLVMSSVFAMSGIVSSRWFVIKNLQKFTLSRTFLGLIVNVVLNFILIPKYGAIGAAFATLISQFVASYLVNFFSRQCRPLFYLQTKSFLFL